MKLRDFDNWNKIIDFKSGTELITQEVAEINGLYKKAKEFEALLYKSKDGLELNVNGKVFQLNNKLNIEFINESKKAVSVRLNQLNKSVTVDEPITFEFYSYDFTDYDKDDYSILYLVKGLLTDKERVCVLLDSWNVVD